MDKQLRFWGFFLAGVFCLAAGAGTLFFGGPLQENLLCAQGLGAFGETVGFFLWMLFFCCGPLKGRQRLAGVLWGFGAAAWLHQCFLPLVVSGLWLLGILMLGSGLRRLAWREKAGRVLQELEDGEEFPGTMLQGLAADFLTGAGSWIGLICLLSAFGIGGLGRVRLLAAVLFVLLFFGHLVFFRKSLPGIFKGLGRYFRKKTGRGRADRGMGALLAILLTMVMIQLARVNLWPDYDSLHYGLRSPYILDNGRGIYENLGNINLVYTYPKGFEILSFPLAGTATFGYVLCFNLWLTLLVLALILGLSWQLSGSVRQGTACAAFASMIPGIMNMAVTAKSDTVTLACQLCVLCAAVGILRESGGGVRRQRGSVPAKGARKGAGGAASIRRWFAVGIGGCFLSFSMKPTAVVFSTVLSVTCLFCCMAAFRKRGKGFFRELFGSGDCPAVFGILTVPAAGAWAGTWIRTYRMTGVPTTSVFTSIWERMGFKVRWPFAFLSIPDQGLEMGFWESLAFLGRRLLGVLFFPVGEDMGHVIIAWGSSLTVLFLLAWLFWGREWKRSRKGRGTREDLGRSLAWGCVSMAGAATGGISLLSLYLLWQVDGNYFMLLYALLAVLGTLSFLEGAEAAGAAKEAPARKRKAAGRIAGPAALAAVFLFQAAVTITTSWAGNPGFTPVKVKHKGYMDHQQALYGKMCSQGSQAIWSVLSQDPRARVIAVGEHPEVLWFPCNVQSYYDVTGSGGNVRLVKTLDNFKEFLDYAGIQYLYVQGGFLEEGTRCYDVVRFLVEDGSLADIRYENGNMVARINLDQAYPADPQWEAEEFYRNIRLKEP